MVSTPEHAAPGWDESVAEIGPPVASIDLLVAVALWHVGIVWSRQTLPLRSRVAPSIFRQRFRLVTIRRTAGTSLPTPIPRPALNMSK